MQTIAYVPITDARLLSSDFPEQTEEYPEWDPDYSFVTGQRTVITTPGIHKIFECIWHTPDCRNKYPLDYLTTTPALWKLVSATNLWKLFDGIVQPDRANVGNNVPGCDWEAGVSWEPGTSWDTTTRSQAHISLLPGQIIDSVNLLNADSTSIDIVMTDPAAGEVYAATKTPAAATHFNGSYDGLPAYPDAILDIWVRNSIGDVNIGELIVGTARTLGPTKFPVSVELIDFSRKTDNGDETYSVDEGNFSKRIDFTFQMQTAVHAAILRLLLKYLSVPLVWIVVRDYSAMLVYGFYRSLKMTVKNLRLSECALSIEGLGGDLVNATPIPDEWVNPWDGITRLVVPGVPTVVVSTSKIEEAPVAVDAIAVSVPAVPTVAAPTLTQYELVGTCTISNAEPGVVTCAGHGLAEDREVFFQNTELLALDVAPGGAGWAVGDNIRGVTSGKTCRIAAVWSTTSYSVYLRTGAFTSGEILTNETAAADQSPGYPTITADNIPLPLTQLTHYFVMYDNVNQFRLSLTVAGSQIDTTTTMVGVAFLLAKKV